MALPTAKDKKTALPPRWDPAWYLAPNELLGPIETRDFLLHDGRSVPQELNGYPTPLFWMYPPEFYDPSYQPQPQMIAGIDQLMKKNGRN
ncbi:MAG: hypothetical protein E6Q97_25705 [Desulfurellales bacterium]|nr:MAG: hypothetical protein E6Q97_25705 [Desulfurellales bacterium]